MSVFTLKRLRQILLMIFLKKALEYYLLILLDFRKDILEKITN